MEAYGIEVIIDLEFCDANRFTRHWIGKYMRLLCGQLQMERAELHFWDDVGMAEKDKQTELHTKGTTAVQFILTSNITIHTLELLSEVYVNIFSCKEFDTMRAATFTRAYFGGEFQGGPEEPYKVITRGPRR